MVGPCNIMHSLSNQPSIPSEQGNLGRLLCNLHCSLVIESWSKIVSTLPNFKYVCNDHTFFFSNEIVCIANCCIRGVWRCVRSNVKPFIVFEYVLIVKETTCPISAIDQPPVPLCSPRANLAKLNKMFMILTFLQNRAVDCFCRKVLLPARSCHLSKHFPNMIKHFFEM